MFSRSFARRKCVTTDVIVIDAISTEREKKIVHVKKGEVGEEGREDQLNWTSIGNYLLLAASNDS